MQIQIEYAVSSGSDRVLAAAVSLTRWYQQECHRLEIERGMAQKELDRGTSDPVEMRLLLVENQIEQQRLDAGWKHSRLRRYVESIASRKATAGAVEQRVAMSPATGPAERATGTSSTTTAKTLYGHGAVFNKWANIGGWFKERIAPGAFTEVIKTCDCRFLLNHDPNYVYGRTTANTLELSEDRIGLRFVCYLLPFDAASYGLARRVDRRDISQCSFSFIVGRDEWKLPSTPGDLDERTILEIRELLDVAAVTYPAYAETDISATFEKVPARAQEPPSAAPVRTISRQEQIALMRDLVDVEGRLKADRERAARIRKLGLTPAIRKAAERW